MDGDVDIYYGGQTTVVFYTPNKILKCIHPGLSSLGRHRPLVTPSGGNRWYRDQGRNRVTD